MPAQLEPSFLVEWVRAELEAQGLGHRLAPLVARAVADGLTEEEAELDAAGQVAEREGLLDRLERAAGDLWLAEVREARGQAERLERAGTTALAWLRAGPGAAERLAELARALAADPAATVAERTHHLGGSPGCSVR